MSFIRVFKIEDNEFKAIFTFTGKEKYYLNGKLLAEFRDKPSSATRKFDIDCDEVSIDYEISDLTYRCSALLNGNMFIEDLFPDWTKAFNANLRNR